MAEEGRMLPLQSLESWFEKWEFTAKHLLACSDCETRSLREIVGDRSGELLDMRLGYTEVRGCDSLREAIAKEFYTTMAKEDIVVFTGAEEAIYCALSTLSPGDCVISLAPAYQSLWACAEARGATVTYLKLVDTDGRWSLDLAALSETLSQGKTKMIILNFPHNPTGWYPTPEEHSQIVQLCEKYNVAWFNDEVYRGLEWVDAHPAACDVTSKGISLGVLSKTQGLAGLRLGWLASKDSALLDRCVELKFYLSICTPGPCELIGEMAVGKNKALVADTRALLEENYKVFEQFLQEHPGWFQWQKPLAGCISFPKVVNPKVTNVYDWCSELAEKGSVLLLPGTTLSPAWEGYVRIGFGRKDFKDNLKALAAYLG